MKGLIWAEVKKIRANRFFFMLICLLFLIQCAYFWQTLYAPGENYYSQADLAAVYSDLRGMCPDEQFSMLEEDCSSLVQELSEQSVETEYTALAGQILARQFVLEHIEKCMDYPGYLDRVSEQAKSLAQSTLMAREDTFSSRNSQAAAETYSRLPAVSLSADSSAGVSGFTQNPLADLFLMLCISVLVMTLTVSEKTEGYIQLLRTKPKGGVQLYAAKLITLFIFSAVLIFVYYGGTYLFLRMSVGFCDLEIPVQSLAEFYQCPYAWDVKMLLVNFLIVKTAVLLAAAGLFFCIGTAASTEVTAYGMGVILFFLSFLMQTFVSPYSAGGFLREAGLTVLLDSTHYFTAVRNVNVFGYPVPAIAVGAISVLLYVGVSTAVSLRFWLHPGEIKISVQRLYRRRRTASAAMKYRSLFSFECKKLFLTERALLLSFGLILLLLFLHIPSRYVSMTEYYYGIYSENLAGDLSAEKEAYLAEEQERIETAGERIDKYYSLYEQGEIDEIELTYYLEKETIPSEQETAFRLAWNQYQKVSEVSTEEDPAVYVNESGWRRLCGAEAAKGQIRDYLIWILYLAACFNHFSCMEDTTGVRTLIRSTADGQKKVSRAKICISLLTGSISAVFLYLVQLCSVHLAWPLYEWDSVQISVQSITVLQNLGLRLPVLYYLILAGVCCAAAGAAAALVTLALSRLMGRPVRALVSAFILLGLPAVLLLI